VPAGPDSETARRRVVSVSHCGLLLSPRLSCAPLVTALPVSALPPALAMAQAQVLGLIQSSFLFPRQWNGVACYWLGSWPRGGRSAGGLSHPCRILTRCCATSLRRAVGVGLQLVSKRLDALRGSPSMTGDKR
jgi:hypothetical protein